MSDNDERTNPPIADEVTIWDDGAFVYHSDGEPLPVPASPTTTILPSDNQYDSVGIAALEAMNKAYGYHANMSIWGWRRATVAGYLAVQWRWAYQKAKHYRAELQRALAKWEAAIEKQQGLMEEVTELKTQNEYLANTAKQLRQQAAEAATMASAAIGTAAAMGASDLVNPPSSTSDDEPDVWSNDAFKRDKQGYPIPIRSKPGKKGLSSSEFRRIGGEFLSERLSGNWEVTAYAQQTIGELVYAWRFMHRKAQYYRNQLQASRTESKALRDLASSRFDELRILRQEYRELSDRYEAAVEEVKAQHKTTREQEQTISEVRQAYAHLSAKYEQAQLEARNREGTVKALLDANAKLTQETKDLREINERLNRELVEAKEGRIGVVITSTRFALDETEPPAIPVDAPSPVRELTWDQIEEHGRAVVKTWAPNTRYERLIGFYHQALQYARYRWALSRKVGEEYEAAHKTPDTTYARVLAERDSLRSELNALKKLHGDSLTAFKGAISDEWNACVLKAEKSLPMIIEGQPRDWATTAIKADLIIEGLKQFRKVIPPIRQLLGYYIDQYQIRGYNHNLTCRQNEVLERENRDLRTSLGDLKRVQDDPRRNPKRTGCVGNVDEQSVDRIARIETYLPEPKPGEYFQWETAQRIGQLLSERRTNLSLGNTSTHPTVKQLLGYYARQYFGARESLVYVNKLYDEKSKEAYTSTDRARRMRMALHDIRQAVDETLNETTGSGRE